MNRDWLQFVRQIVIMIDYNLFGQIVISSHFYERKF
jgi:hypothetical protein